MSVLTLSLFYLIATSSTSNCLASAEDYSAEVVIPHYNIAPLLVLAEKSDSTYIMPSQYSDNLLTLTKETDNPGGLSVRLQIPTEIREIDKPHAKFISYSATGHVRDNLPGVFTGWQIQCTESSCIFDKDLVLITAPRQDSRNEVSVEINQKLDDCSSSCSGVCFETQTGSKCIDNTLRLDIDRILQYTNTSRDLRSLLTSYRSIGSENIVLNDVVPANSNPVDWQEAMRQELVYLAGQRVIDLTRDDIETISSLAKEGQAGDSYRIVFDTSSSKWRYANEVPNVIPSQQRDCRAYSLPSTSPAEQQGAQLYYVVPFAILGGGCILLVILIVIARFVTRKPSKR